MTLSRREFLAASAAVATLPVVVRAAEAPKKLVLIGGTMSHGPGDHEFNAGVRLLAKCLANVKELKVEVVTNGYPKDDSILDGAKRGFGVPLGAWFRGNLGYYARDLLLDRTTLDRGYLNESVVRSVLDAHRAGQGDRSLQLWALMMLESWHRDLGDGYRSASSPASSGAQR